MDQSNLVELFQASAAEHADTPAMRYKRDGGWHTVTYAGMQRFIEDLAGGLLSLELDESDPAGDAPVERWIALAQDHQADTAEAATRPETPSQPQGTAEPFGDVDPVTDVEGIAETFGGQLAELGIETTRDLWHADTHRIAEALDTSPKRVNKWQQMAELMAISGIGPQYAELLVRTGVDTISELAHADAEELTPRLQQTEEELIPNIQGNPIRETRVAGWIELARDHAPGTGEASAWASTEAGDPFGDVDPVVDVEGIGEVYGEKLVEHGVETTRDLWHADTHRVAEALDTSPNRVKTWQQMAELMAVSGIGPQYAELLVRSGIGTIHALAAADLDELATRIREKEAAVMPNIQGNEIGDGRIRRWITLARDHAPDTAEDPDGTTAADPQPTPLTRLEGLDPRAADRLGQAGVATVDDLADADPDALRERLLGQTEPDGTGLPQGARIGVWSANSPEWVLADYATLHVGGVSVPVYETLTPDQATYILDDAGARVVFVEDEEKLEALLQRLDELETVERLVVMGPVPAGYEDKAAVLGMDEMYTRGRRFLDEHEDVLADRVEAIEPDDLASFVYTSGTTGDPKGVMVTHRNFASNVEATLEVLPIAEETHLGFLPLAHSFARTGDEFVPYSSGSTVCFAESVDQLTENMQEIHPTIMLSVPRLYEKMHARIREGVEESGGLKARLFDWALDVGREHARRTTEDEDIPATLKLKHRLAERLVFDKLQEITGGRLRFFVSGGAALSPEIMEFFGAAGLWIMQGYGLTETSPVLAANAPGAYRFGSVGRPLPNVDIRIDETVWDGPEGEGEIQAQGPNITQGYWQLPDETEALFTEDGWLRTGDVGRFDEDGFLYITDRLKKIFKTAYGKYIVPNKLENKLTDRPFIAQAVAIGEDKKYVGALIAPDFERLADWAEENGLGELDPEALVEHEAVHDLIFEQVEIVNESLARYESIKRIQLLPRELDQEHDELTPTLKVKRRVVKETWADKIDALYPDG